MKKVHDYSRKARMYDQSGVGLSVALLKEQIINTDRVFPKKSGLPRKQWTSIVVCGMGGSALGADVLRSLYEPYMTVPMYIVNDYSIPRFVTHTTLVVLCSYSGTTEEVIACLAESRARKLHTFIISTGGVLGAAAKKFRIPHFLFDDEHNPSKQPRLGTGYTMTALYRLIQSEHLLTKSAPDFIGAVRSMQIDSAVPNRFAAELYKKSCIIIAAEHLRGNAHVLSNQLNESAKVFAPYYSLPELNHHLLEGLGSLRGSRKDWVVVFLESKNYSARIKARFAITRKVMEKQGFTTRSISFIGSPGAECLKMLSFSGFLTYYLSLLARKDPSAIPWVDYFKKELAKH